MAFVVGRLKTSGHRFIANDGNHQTLQKLSSTVKEQVGKVGYVKTERTDKGDPERNVFFLGPKPGL